ncbi:hypothetical protein, partial [Kitasatospora nipponensis]|uniref:hypothetical protein n=1 Tax=Kitasatospora nipponensis TaxID=258049 RepID=UPI0031D61D47
VSNFCIVFSGARRLFLTTETLRCFPDSGNKHVAQWQHHRSSGPFNCCNGLNINATVVPCHCNE